MLHKTWAFSSLGSRKDTKHCFLGLRSYHKDLLDVPYSPYICIYIYRIVNNINIYWIYIFIMQLYIMNLWMSINDYPWLTYSFCSKISQSFFRLTRSQGLVFFIPPRRHLLCSPPVGAGERRNPKGNHKITSCGWKKSFITWCSSSLAKLVQIRQLTRVD